jgi:hypothetical protein
MSSTNGTTHDNGHSADVDIDTLYSFWPGLTPAPQPCPEAAFSITLRGTIGGHEALLTARGMTSEEFQRNLQSITGVLDPAPQPMVATASPGEDWCGLHNLKMKWNEGKDGKKGWYSHRYQGEWCKGK